MAACLSVLIARMSSSAKRLDCGLDRVRKGLYHGLMQVDESTVFLILSGSTTPGLMSPLAEEGPIGSRWPHREVST